MVGAILTMRTLTSGGIHAPSTPLYVALVLLAGVVAVSWLVCSVIATFKALNGESYRYPFTLRLL